MDKDKVITTLTTVIIAVGVIAIIVGAVVIYRKYQFSDGLTYAAVVIVVLYFFITAVAEVLAIITDEQEGSGSNIINDSPQPGKDEDDPLTFRRPVGIIPSIYDPENVFTDIHGHEYRKLYGVWWDDNGNVCPDYLKGIYGISSYEESHEKDY
ncbi:MAG: hypothetical protein IKD84_00185 [Erysipelotrichaceae bacterium]|nr:hypothetical protein [Erysipelotrichaceae bacterium]